MTQEQIKTVLRGIEETLRMIARLPEYQKLQNSEYFTTSNDLTLGDTIQSISEVYEGILEVQYREELNANQAKSEAQLDLAQNHPWS